MQRRQVDFDTYDVTVDELLRRVSRGRIDIAPIYQRQFRWPIGRQSRLIESVLLGIPVPPLFMATNTHAASGSSWEVVDGLQRLLSLVNFAGDPDARAAAGLSGNPAKLIELEKLTDFEGLSFQDLPKDIQTGLEDRPMKVIVLNDKSDLQVRFDLFERLNTGGIVLSAHEIRQSVYRGEFIDKLARLSQTTDFTNFVVLPESRWKDGTPQDFVLRFFAFLNGYSAFNHSVQDFLNHYAADMVEKGLRDDDIARFHRTFSFLRRAFPDGLKTRKGATPVNLFEAVTVGAALALDRHPSLGATANPTWIASEELRSFTTGATNSRPRVKGRIEYCRDKFLEANA
ncbi:DUF262 domain-containing protein [Paenarthrobacter sp. OM7]|uniref:DUF262 domain-containing protein n=1 Tax=Paenarthrobacter sp. OM7 TaxID=3041264 RepID=UPI0024694652|nr:DUF262 domain-containing protein [Paenarthrobacter sp. OM7]WGM22794.1 DUF262 domain-containing protein [Paenarthrobacter sp. OM7]